jgi:hypothetical protein
MKYKVERTQLVKKQRDTAPLCMLGHWKVPVFDSA